MLARRHALVSILSLVSLALPANSQAPKGAQRVQEISFPGGTLDGYVGLLREKFPNSSIITDGVGKTALPEARIHSTLGGAVGWVPNAAGPRGAHLVLHTTRSDTSVVYTFTSAQPDALRAAADANTKVVKTYAILNADGWSQPSGAQLRNLLDSLMTKRTDTPGVYFDPTMRLLIVSAPASDIRIADQVIEEMIRARRTAQALSTASLETRNRELTRRSDSLEAVIRELRKSKY